MRLRSAGEETLRKHLDDHFYGIHPATWRAWQEFIDWQPDQHATVAELLEELNRLRHEMPGQWAAFVAAPTGELINLK